MSLNKWSLDRGPHRRQPNRLQLVETVLENECAARRQIQWPLNSVRAGVQFYQRSARAALANAVFFVWENFLRPQFDCLADPSAQPNLE